jgi:uncharacterized membrane protein YjjP (DUF1212 family)
MEVPKETSYLGREQSEMKTTIAMMRMVRFCGIRDQILHTSGASGTRLTHAMTRRRFGKIPT